jgi:hypothetical protein
MDAYDVLQISRDATLDEAEAAYHRLLRIHHPDVHASHGPEALAEAEAHTRELNQAIAVLRRTIRRQGPMPPGGWIEPPPGPPSDEATAPATCPICEAPVTSLDEFERHLALRHGELGRKRRRTRPPSPRVASMSRWLVDAWYAVPVVFAAFPGILGYWLYLELGLPPLGVQRPSADYGAVALLSITAFWALRTTIPRRE